MVSVVVLSKEFPYKVTADLAEQTYRDFEFIWACDEGIVNAMNGALKAARGDIFVRIDDDVKLPTIWLEELIRPFEDPKTCGVTGPTFIPFQLRNNRDSIKAVNSPSKFLWWLFDGSPYAAAQIYKCGSVSYGSNFQNHLRNVEYSIDYLEGTNWAMRTELIRQVGGFDPAFDGVAEWFDTDVVFKIKKLGYKITYARNAFLWHLVKKGEHFEDRYEGLSRIKNWLRFHWRHSKFHPKMVIWFLMMCGYFILRRRK